MGGGGETNREGVSTRGYGSRIGMATKKKKKKKKKNIAWCRGPPGSVREKDPNKKRTEGGEATLQGERSGHPRRVLSIRLKTPLLVSSST